MVSLRDTSPLRNLGRITLNDILVGPKRFKNFRNEFEDPSRRISADKAVVNGSEKINHCQTDTLAENRPLFSLVVPDRCVISHQYNENIAFFFTALKKERVSNMGKVKYAGGKDYCLASMPFSDISKVFVMNNHFEPPESYRQLNI